jgi:hypothetical protein
MPRRWDGRLKARICLTINPTGSAGVSAGLSMPCKFVVRVPVDLSRSIRRESMISNPARTESPSRYRSSHSGG